MKTAARQAYIQREGSQESSLYYQQHQYQLIPQPHPSLVIDMFWGKWKGCQGEEDMTPQQRDFIHVFLINWKNHGECFASVSSLTALLARAETDKEEAVGKTISKIRKQANDACIHSFKIGRLKGSKYPVDDYMDCVIIPYPGLTIVPSFNMQDYPDDLYEFDDPERDNLMQ